MTQAAGARDLIQLTDLAVLHLVPAYATEEDMFSALDKCGLTQQQIFDELDRRLSVDADSRSVEELADEMLEIIYDSFNYALAEATAHKAPFNG